MHACMHACSIKRLSMMGSRKPIIKCARYNNTSRSGPLLPQPLMHKLEPSLTTAATFVVHFYLLSRLEIEY
jgi:hypothetical protein